MKRLTLSFIVLASGHFLLASKCPRTSNGNAAQSTDEEVVSALGSTSSEEATRAVAEVMHRGERMIPHLVRMRGCRNVFFGAGLGNPHSSQLIPAKSVPGLPAIPLEQAALFLIVGIYNQNLSFAESPYLADLTLRPQDRKASTSKSLNRRAWKSVLAWNRRRKDRTLESARANNDAPLKGAMVGFW
jgi:hypothetical protein